MSSVAFITGASSGLGRGLAVRLAQEGWAVGLAARREDRLHEVLADVRDYGGRGGVYPCDVGDKAAVQAAVAACVRELGPVSLLVANAGVGHRTEPETFDSEDVERVLRVNFLGAVYAVEAVLPEMLRQGEGHLVGVGSLAGYGGLPKTSAYSASKGALINFFESLRLDLRPKGIAVTVINPGFVRTEMTDQHDRPRPFMLELDQGVEHMMQAIKRRRRSARFPWPLSTLVAAARLFPRWLYDALAGRVPR